MEHWREWTGDRDVALALRRDCFLKSATALYENDDKCGSWWLKLPVMASGREVKDSVKQGFHFAIQCNAICGWEGLIRLTVVPKNVDCGSNFGLTNFIITLFRAKQMGRLPLTMTRCYRHTDGGPDNLSHVTHILHYLLVYLGVFEDFWWFRFRAGHSHTEISDRFFSLLKRIFDSDGPRTVDTATNSFQDLEAKLEEVFKGMPETLAVEWNFANWDFETWLRGCVPGVESGMFEGNFARYTFDNVFRYQYDRTLPSHGCVHVTYKESLSWRGDSKNAEWKPWQDVNGRNDTEKAGVLFVRRPPDLRHPPAREAFSDKDKNDAADMCKSLLKRHGSGADPLPPSALSDWALLHKVFSGSPHSGAVPDMPHEATISSGEATPWLGQQETAAKEFEGSPMDFNAMLKELMRFDRPNITHDIFTEPPPSEFPKTWAGAPEAPAGTSGVATDGATQRDARLHNSVIHAGYTQGDRSRAMRGLDDEEWLASTQPRLEVVDVEGGLYIVKLDIDEKDGELLVGLVRFVASTGEEDGQTLYKVVWYRRVAQDTKHMWGNTVSWRLYSEAGVTADVELESFLLAVNDDDQTASSSTDTPCLNDGFMRRLRLFCRREGLVQDPPQAAKPKAKPKAANPAPNKRAPAHPCPAAKPAAKAAKAAKPKAKPKAK